MKALQQHHSRGQRNGNKHKPRGEYHGSHPAEKTDNLKNVIIMRHGRVVSYHTWNIYFLVHILLNKIRAFTCKYRFLNESALYKVLSKSIESVKKGLDRHISSDLDYMNLNYGQFMRLLSCVIDPPLAAEGDDDITIEKMPKLDVIYHSSSMRSIQSAKRIQNLYKSNKSRSKSPRIEHGLERELDEVRFSKDIISKEEFEK